MNSENICETIPGSNEQDKHEKNHALDDAIPPSMPQALNRCSGDEWNRTNLHRISNNPECWNSNRGTYQGIHDDAIRQANSYGGRAYKFTQDELLDVKTKEPTNVPVMTTRFNPTNPDIKKFIHENWNIIDNSNDCS